MEIALPEGVKKIIKTLEDKGYEAYLVGGSLRDILMGMKPHDWDIATSALPGQVMVCFSAKKVITTGLKHGTLTILQDGISYEVTTYRIEDQYSDNRHPDEVFFTSSLKEDLSRRDFTVNAMAYNPAFGLVDLFDGCRDLYNKQINCVGDPQKRFSEDALRMMRALRFASVLGFQIGGETALAIHRHKLLLQKISAERLNLELCLLLGGKNVENILRGYAEVLNVFIPELAPMQGFIQNNRYHYLDVWEHTVKAVALAPDDLLIRLTLLFHDIAKPECYTEDEEGNGHFYGHPKESSRLARIIMKRLKFANKTIEAVSELVLYHDSEISLKERSIKKWLNKLGEERIRQLLLVKEADAKAQHEKYRGEKLAKLAALRQGLELILAQGQCFALRDMAIDGSDLLQFGIPKGKQIGEVLDRLLALVLEGKIENDREKLLAKAKMLSK